MSIKNTILEIHPIIRNALFLFLLTIATIFYFIQEGISIDTLKIGNFKIEGLYLKLDNKLTLKVKHLYLPKENNNREIISIEKDIKDLKRVLFYFDYIELDSVEFTNDNYYLLYTDNTIYIRNDQYEFSGMFTPQNGGLIINLPLVYIKKYDLRLSGKLSYQYSNARITFAGNYSVLHIDGNISTEILDKKVKFFISSSKFSNLSELLDMVDIPSQIRPWIDKNVVAKQYRLEKLIGTGLWSDNGFVLNEKSLKAEAFLKNVHIKFKNELYPVTAESMIIDYHDNRLDFALKKPKYKKKNMSGSKVSIVNIGNSKPSSLLLKLIFACKYDKEIDDILKSYKITVPVSQTKGSVKATINLDVRLDNFDTKVEGRVFISKGIMRVGGVPLPTNGGEVTFTSNRVALWNLDIHDSWYSGKVNGYINLDTKRANYKVDLKRLTIGDKNSVHLSIKNKKKFPVTMDYGHGLKFELPSLKMSIITNKSKGIKITNNDIRKILPFVKKLPLGLKSGKISINTNNYEKYNFNGKVKIKNSYIYGKNGYISSIPIKGSIGSNGANIEALKGKFVYKGSSNTIWINNLNIDAKKLLTKNSSAKLAQTSKITVKGKNSIIRYGKHVLITDKFNLRIRGKNITFVGYKDGDMVRLEKNGNSLVVHANKIKDRMLRALINFGGLHGGRYSLDLLGNTNEELSGVIDIKGGAIDSFKAYNDLIALFNTIPALMTLSDPGFSKRGYVTKDGKIKFRIIKDMVVFDSIYINGKSSTIVGKGSIDLNSGKINMDLAIRTAREVGKVLGSLPIVGYILFGKDKSITTGVKITGTLDKPRAKTHPVREALLYPLELIKRTITSPAHIINK